MKKKMIYHINQPKEEIVENPKNEEKEENKEEVKQEEEKEKEKEIKEENNDDNTNKKENNENNDIDAINKELASNRRITNDEVKECSTLILEEKESSIFNGEKIQINASGMIGGRGVGDGITIFGSNPNNQGEEGSNMNTGVSSLKPDFILNLKEKFN